MTLADAAEHIDHEVIYDPGLRALTERGVIASVGRKYVFVRFGGSPTPKATLPADLTLAGAK